MPAAMENTPLACFYRQPRRESRLVCVLLAAILAGCSSQPKTLWRLTDISGHMPDLEFQLTNDHGKAVSAASIGF